MEATVNTLAKVLAVLNSLFVMDPARFAARKLREDRILLIEHKQAFEYHRAMVAALEQRIHNNQRHIKE